MSDIGVFVASVAVYAGLPLVYTARRTPFRFLLLYAHLACVLTLGGILGAIYVVPVAGTTVLAGQIAYAGFIFSTMVTLIAGRELHVLRNVMVLVVGVDLVVFLLFRISLDALGNRDVLNPAGTPAGIFDQSLRSVLLGGLLIIAELVVISAVLELSKRHVVPGLMPLVYVVTYVGVLLADGVLFPALVLTPTGELGELIRSGVHAKLVLAGAYVVPLLGFVLVNRTAVSRFEATTLRLRDLVSLSRDQLLDQLDESREQVGRATATVDRLLAAANTTMLIATDTETRMTHFNAGAQAVLGYTEEEVIGRSTAMLHDPEVLRRQAAELDVPLHSVAALMGRLCDGQHRDWEYRRRDGRPVLVSLGVTEIRDGDTLIGYLAAGEDVTDRAHTEAVLAETVRREQAAVARLEEADRVKDELVSTVSHELRTPITSINGYVELLADGAFGELTHPQGEALVKVERNISRLEALVDDLLFVARGDDGRPRVRLLPTDLCSVVRSSWDTLESLAADRGHRLASELPTHGVLVLGDAQALERLVLNLAGNAIKFTPDGGRVSVEVAEPEQGGAVLTVRDTGIGIAPEDLDRVFDRFFRATEANERAIQGSGLGLHVVQGIVTSHGGTIGIDSTPGAGTVVTVRLPAPPRGATVDGFLG